RQRPKRGLKQAPQPYEEAPRTRRADDPRRRPDSGPATSRRSARSRSRPRPPGERDGHWTAVSVWESQDAFDRFRESRVVPAVADENTGADAPRGGAVDVCRVCRATEMAERERVRERSTAQGRGEATRGAPLCILQNTRFLPKVQGCAELLHGRLRVRRCAD